jgi:hypothetical protein
MRPPTKENVNISTVIQITLASILIPVGLLKLVRGKTLAGNSGMRWMNDFSSRAVAAIGISEVFAGGAMLAGSIVPNRPASLLGACIAVVIMAGAAYTHFRRKEHRAIVFPAVLGAASLVATAFQTL